MNIEMIFSLLGGLGLFLYGLKLMSEGIENVAGSKMKGILEMCTKNRLVGVIVGAIFTAVIQSSSAATVMVVSFVNSGLMTLMQSVGVIMGANIGTSITAQLVVLKFEAIAPLFIICGVIMVMFFKKPIIQKMGEVIIGFGILFLGIGLMKDSMTTLGESQKVVNAIASMKNPLVALLVGIVVTTVIQSSSAAVGIMIVMASQGLVTLPMCFYFILGANIGSCVSALMVSFTGKKNAKRAALIHLLYNVIGSLAIFVLIMIFEDTVNGWFTLSMDKNVANAQIIIKIVQMVMLFPFARWNVKLTEIIVPGEDEKKEEFELQFITMDGNIAPATAIIEVTNEIKRMGKIATENLEKSMEAFMKKDQSMIDDVLYTEREIDFLSRKITDYLVGICQSIPISEVKNIAGYYHVVNDIERIGDHAENIAEFAKVRIEEEIDFSAEGESELAEIFDYTDKSVRLAIEAFADRNARNLQEIVKCENKVDELEKKIQNAHIRRLSQNICSPKASIFSDLVTNLERVSDHATNIGFAIYKEEEYI